MIFYDKICPLRKCQKIIKMEKCVNVIIAKDNTGWLGTVYMPRNIVQMSESVHEQIGSS